MLELKKDSFRYDPEIPLLIVGFGNLLMKDEGAGVFAIEELRKHNLPKNVTLIEGGTMGVDAISLFEEYERVIIIDCIGVSGNIPEHTDSFIEFTLDQVEIQQQDEMFSAHDIDLNAVLLMMKNLGMNIPKILFFGIIPEIIDYGLNEISENVQKSVHIIVDKINKLINNEKNEWT